jgi:NAD(P)-dependent dehydrogenase (short-subunit alcohol dehydrogenase family)
MDLKSSGVDAIYCQGNIGEPGDRANIISKAAAHFKRINLLVNNAGVAPQKRNDLLDLDEASYDRLMNINLKGTFFLTQQVARHMQSEKQKDAAFQGCIISITSMSAEVASVNRAEYCMSKAALGMMTKLFAVRLSEFDVPVYEIRPGIFKTDMTSVVQEKYDRLIEGGLTLEKRWGMPEDIGKIVVVLAKGEIPYSTGQMINADGGLTISRL